MALLSIKEKEDLVIDLLNRNCTLREIAAKAHVSFSFIAKISKKLSGEECDGEPRSKSLSISSQAFQLFKEGKSHIDVKILLDVSKDEVVRIFSDYLILKNMREVAIILQEYKNNLSPFVKLFNFIKQNNTKRKDIVTAVRYVNNLNLLGKQKQVLENEIKKLTYEQNYLLNSISEIKTTYY